jgi:phage terminase small subunit
LKAAGRAYWSQVVAEFALERHQLTLLDAACRELDRAAAADAELATSGLMITGGDGRTYAHPMVNVARDARQGFLRLVKSLHLEAEPTNERRPLRAIG